MASRTLTVMLNPDWRTALRAAGRAARQLTYQGETLNFGTPADLFERLTARRWAFMGAGAVSVRELARRVDRDMTRVHEDVTQLAELGLVERTPTGGVLCPVVDIRVDLRLHRAA